MDSFVQLVRNGLCCIKDWEILGNSFLFDPSYTAMYYTFPPPLNKTTPLEILIAITQFYAFVAVTLSGYQLITQSGVWKLRRIKDLMAIHAKTAAVVADGDKKKNDDTDENLAIANRIVSESLSNEKSAAARSIFVGVNVLSIGLSFLWLFSNSLHITETNWIGGLQGLIHALTVMNIALMPLLYYMIKDGNDMIRKSRRMEQFSRVLVESKGRLSSAGGGKILNAETYGWIKHGGWTSFWSGGVVGPLSDLDSMEGEKKLNKEVADVKRTVGVLLTESSDKVSKGSSSGDEVLRQAVMEASSRLQHDASLVRMEGYREYLYFVLNFIAFYGYLLPIICFYYDDDVLRASYVGSLKFGLTNADADWHGNFAGDFAWTLEPLVVFASPFLMGWMKPQIAKVKTD